MQAPFAYIVQYRKPNGDHLFTEILSNDRTLEQALTHLESQQRGVPRVAQLLQIDLEKMTITPLYDLTTELGDGPDVIYQTTLRKVRP